MRKFDETIEEIQSQFTPLTEAEAGPTLSGYYNKASAAVGANFQTQNWNEKNLYYLKGGGKSLPALTDALANVTQLAVPKPPPIPPTLAYPTPPTPPDPPEIPMFDPAGNLSPYRQRDFAEKMNEVFKTSVSTGRNGVERRELVGDRLQTKQTQNKFNNNSPDLKGQHDGIMKFINNIAKISNLIAYVTPEQAAELDKGGLGKRVIGALDSAVGRGMQYVAQNATKGLGGTVNYN